MPLTVTLTGANKAVVGAKGAPHLVQRGETITMSNSEWAALPAATQVLFMRNSPKRGTVSLDDLDAEVSAGPQPAIASPTSDTVGTKAAIDAIRVALQVAGITL